MPDLPRRRPVHRFTVNFLLVVVLSVGADFAFAHAIVVHTSLKDRPVRSQTPTTVLLRFSLRIQLPFTKMTLADAHGGSRSLDFSPGQRTDEVEVKLPPLPAGPYVLRYKVLAIDGHLTEGVVRFAVSAPR